MRQRQPVSAETKQMVREILAEPYDPNWRSKITKEITDRQNEVDRGRPSDQ